MHFNKVVYYDKNNKNFKIYRDGNWDDITFNTNDKLYCIDDGACYKVNDDKSITMVINTISNIIYKSELQKMYAAFDEKDQRVYYLASDETFRYYSGVTTEHLDYETPNIPRGGKVSIDSNSTALLTSPNYEIGRASCRERV